MNLKNNLHKGKQEYLSGIYNILFKVEITVEISYLIIENLLIKDLKVECPLIIYSGLNDVDNHMIQDGRMPFNDICDSEQKIILKIN